MKGCCPFFRRADFMVLVLLDCDGDLNHVVTLTLEIQAEGQTTPTRIAGSLPPNPVLAGCDEQWRSLHRQSSPTPAQLAQRQTLTADLIRQFNQWLRSASDRTLGDMLRACLNPNDEILVVVQARDERVQGLPWQQWDGLADYPNAAIAFQHPNPQAERRELKQRDRTSLQPLRILMVLGPDSPHEDSDRTLPATEFCTLVAPSRAQLHQHLWNAQGWDLLYLSGAHLNPDHTAQMLDHGLKKAVKQGLVVVMVNMTDGLAFVPTLAAWGVLYAIVMREPVPDGVAQTLLHQVLRNLQRGQSLPFAVRTAQAQLPAGDCPGGSGWPMVYHLGTQRQPLPGRESLTWDDLNPTATLPCPYRGLGVFTAADAAVFRGRQTMVERLAYGVYSQPLVALVGASGTGKSSLVLAGLVPQFASEAAIAIFRPGTTPLLNLANALAALLPTPDPLLALQLATGEANVLAVIKTALQHQEKPRLLLIADQFEELFTGCDRTIQAEFLEIFLSPVHAADTAASPWHTPKLTVILTLRADFLEAALNDAQLAPLLCRHQPELLMPMTPKSLHAAIVEPAEVVGMGLEAGLADRIVAAVGDEPGRLPWLEFTLTRLWEYQRKHIPEGLRSHQLTHRAYEAIGGVEQAIARYAEQAYNHLSTAAQTQTRHIFTRLVQPGHGTAATRRLVSPDQLGDRKLLTYWAEHQFLVVAPDRVELVHEVLIYAWDRFQTWLLEDRGFHLWQERSRPHWQQWHQAGYADEHLLRDITLTEAAQWLTQREGDLVPEAREWIAASLAVQQQRVRSRRWRVLWCSAGVLLVLAWVSAIRWQRHHEQDNAPTSRVCPAVVRPLDGGICG
jgi:hypothetical protein